MGDQTLGRRAIAEFVQFRNGKTSPDRPDTAEVPVYGSNGPIGWCSEPNAEGPLIVIGRVGSFCGSLQYVDGPAWVTDNALVAKAVEPDETRFWYYALQTARLNERSHGSGQPLLNQSILREIELPCHSRNQRLAIAEVLGALDDKITANDRVIASADQLASALLQQALADRSVPLVEVAAVTMGSSPPGTSYNEDGTGMPFFQGVRDFGVRFPTRRVWTTAPVRRASEGDVLLSVRAPVGRTNVANEELCLGRGVAGLRPRDGRSATLLHQVRAAHDAWAPYEAEGTVFGSINRGQLESIDIPAIDQAAADVLERQLQALETRIAAALEENHRLAATRDELLPLLMSGKVRVKDDAVADAL